MKRLLFLSCLFLGVACGNAGQSSEKMNEAKSETLTVEQKLWDEMMVIHDEVMPKMSDISRIRRHLNAYLKSHPDLMNEQKMNIENAIVYLDKGDEGMMLWMNNLKQLRDLRKSKTHEDIVNYLKKRNRKNNYC